MKTFEVWSPDWMNAEEATSIDAYSATEAAEQFARKNDEEWEQMNVRVRGAELHNFVVYRRINITYDVRPK